MTASELREKTCCFTGHRDLPEGHIRELSERTALEIRSLIATEGVRFFGVGGAVGYDTLAASVLFELRKTEFPDIKVILVYPFDGFTKCWPPKQQENYKKMLPNYDKVVCVSNTANRGAYLARDRHLVDGSAYCITYCTRNSGGTAYTVRYAKERGLKIRNIAK